MRRFTIARLMLVVVFVAANFALIRLLLEANQGEVSTQMLFIGLLPLADSLAIALWFVCSRCRYTIRRRARGEGGGFAWWYVMVCTPILLCLVAASVISPTIYFGYAEWTWQFLEPRLKTWGLMSDFDTRIGSHVYLPAIFGVLFSAPPILFVVAIACFLSRFRIAVTLRGAQPCTAPRSEY